MPKSAIAPNGFLLPNECRITHGTGATIRTPFADIPLTMHELYPGGTLPAPSDQRGQFGFIPFTHTLRLPRHVHGTLAEQDCDSRLLAERILVMGGTGLVELNGAIYVIPHGGLVDIPAGVPHTWSACPPGVTLPDDTVTSGTFLMIYDYAEPTTFFPIETTQTLAAMADYTRYDGPLDAICFPTLTAVQVQAEAAFVWNEGVVR